MEEVKILVYAFVSFLSQEQLPIAATSAEIEINRETRQIRLHQYDLHCTEPYAELAKAGLDSLMRTHTLNADLAPISMTSKHMYEDEGKLNAILYLHYKDDKDLRKISFYADAEGRLSYPYIHQYNYDLEQGRIDGRYIRFDAQNTVKFTMRQKGDLSRKTYSLANAWKALENEKFIDVSAEFSKKDFEKVRKFVFKNGDRRTFRNMDNGNPHYRFSDFDLYLGASGQLNLLETKKIARTNYNELVIHDKQYYTLYFITGEQMGKNRTNLKKDRVYWHNTTYAHKEALKAYLQKLKDQTY
ncbi:Hypothetical protein I595_939 [Croceitalea dokdonensis DOKDO 023]|uniref:Uncharacterized protein n=1 Tax=Croceitalea dokdonensis DOKDO 023 TaxID=1300341 RepID=A0A0P7A6X9_9FLAO|nr:hypothetical protein [Croceitalea dokdonensis]KPM32521.1 Hypothetical protein I595_939 [Croceitalea dokdonensis DOKDO 023]